MGHEVAAVQILDTLAPPRALLPFFLSGVAEAARATTSVAQVVPDGDLRALLLRRKVPGRVKGEVSPALMYSASQLLCN